VSYDLTSDDEALLTALAVLEQDLDDSPRHAAAGIQAEAVDTLTRLYHEALGLIPSSLPPMVPNPEVKRRLMAAISANSLEPEPGHLEAVPAAASPAGLAGQSPWQRAQPWMGLAAALFVALLGVSAWLYQGLAERNEAVAQLTSERTAALVRVGEAEERLLRAESEAKSMRQSFAVVTSPAVEVCALRPSSPMAEVAGAHGILFVAADHQHWYMSLRGLQPAGAGKVYQLWFVGQQGPVSAGTFSGDAAKPWELGSEHMPLGTKEVRITLEDGSGSPAPRGPEVLRNSDLFRVL
jgi:hypothetical protein